MKSIIAIVLLALTLSSQAAPSIVHALCENDRGTELELKFLPAFETSPPPHEVVLSSNGFEYSRILMREHFGMDQMDYHFFGYDDDYEVTLSIDMKTETVYYQLAANNGASPLPPQIFENCVIEAGF